MPVALVTGEVAEAAAVCPGFERHGFEVHTVAPWGSNRLPARGIDCYVQLSGGTAGPGLGRAGLVGRLDLLALLARRLSPLATVLLVVNESDSLQPGSPSDMLAALALVVLEEAGRDRVRVVVLPAEELSGAPAEVVITDVAVRPALSAVR